MTQRLTLKLEAWLCRYVTLHAIYNLDRYISHDQVMHSFAPHYERKTRSNRSKKRPRESNASSSSTTLNHPSLSHLLDDTLDENDDESFHSNSSSPSQNISSLSNVVSRVCDLEIQQSEEDVTPNSKNDMPSPEKKSLH
ncbi:hypothetical protein Tco_1339361 [Tanacetum coccineum]